MSVSPKFFDTMQIPVLRGRDFDARDVANPTASALINETAAKKFFPNEDPIGQRVGQIAGGERRVGDHRRHPRHQVRQRPRRRRRRRSTRRSARDTRSLTVMVRTAGEPSAMTETVRTALQQVDPDVPMTGITTQSEQVEGRFAQERLFALAYSLFGGLALLLACIGLFGLMSYSVSRRTNEIGIRMALGAQRAGVVGMVLRESMLMVVDRRRDRPCRCAGRRTVRRERVVRAVDDGCVDDQRRHRRDGAGVVGCWLRARPPRLAGRSDGGPQI